MEIGARFSGGVCDFTVWAPLAETVSLTLASRGEECRPMERDRRGYWRTTVRDLSAGERYLYLLDGETALPDPASRFQPSGVHGPSEVVDHGSFRWNDGGFRPAPLPELIFYEIHIGTFTEEGTFDAAAERLDALSELGINAIELMPVAQFAGSRNWGYDGVYLFAPQNSYGGPAGLKHFVDACHERRISVFLDVVYNHFGPEGNYLAKYGPYFTDQYHTPWGEAINFDDEHSDQVRNFYLENARYWLESYHIDGLRLDAIDQIKDTSAVPILQELALSVSDYSVRSGKTHSLVAESDLNDRKVITVPEVGGFGLDAQWNDDYHHAIHTLLTGEHHGYYVDYGKIHHLADAYRRNYVYDGKYSVFRKRRHGNSAAGIPPYRFVVNIQNHDQIGNRARGDRLSSLVSFEEMKLAAGALILSPFLPFLFMGQEYGEDAPFQYFVDFGDAPLVQAVREGRRKEFSSFRWQGEVPDPQDPETFERSKLSWEARGEGRHRLTLELYRRLIALRRTHPALAEPAANRMTVIEDERSRVLSVWRWHGTSHALMLMNFSSREEEVPVPFFENPWRKILCTAAEEFGGDGDEPPGTTSSEHPVTLPPQSFSLYESEETV